MGAKRFTVELERVQKTATMLRVRFDPREAFAGLSTTHRRAYAGWIDEAKRPETRARRIAAAVERAREGRPSR